MEIDRELMREVRRQAAEQSRDARTLIEEMIEESIRTRRFPSIGFRGGPTGRRAWILGTPLDVWEMVELYRGKGRERLIEEHGVFEGRLDLTLAYYEAYPEEIDRRIAANARTPAEWHRLSPSVIPPPPPEPGEARRARMRLLLDAHMFPTKPSASSSAGYERHSETSLKRIGQTT